MTITGIFEIPSQNDLHGLGPQQQITTTSSTLLYYLIRTEGKVLDITQIQM